MSKANTYWLRKAAGVVGLSLLSSAAYATELTYAIGYPPGSSPVIAAESMAKYSAENGGPDIDVYAMSLLNLKETPPGIRDAVVDMGFSPFGLYSAEFANSNLAAEFSVLATNAVPADDHYWASMAMSGAITEYIMLNCKDCGDEFAKEKQVYLSGQASGTYALHCLTDVTTAADLKGKQVRTPSGYWAGWVTAMGATSVAMSANEAFSAMSQGVVDCVVFQPSDLIVVRLIDVVKSTTLGVPQGLYAPASVANINQDAWKGLSADERRVLLEAAAYMNAEMTYLAADQTILALNMEKERNIPILTAAPDLKAASDAYIAGLRETVTKQYTTQYNIQDIEAKIDTVEALIKKWVDLTKDVKTTDAMFNLLKTEVYSKVDVETYGL